MPRPFPFTARALGGLVTLALALSLQPAAASASPTPATRTTTDLRDPDTDLILGWASHDLATMEAEEAAFGTTNDMLSTYVDFVQQPDFPAAYAEAARTRGAALLIAWEPWDWAAAFDEQPEFAPQNIAAGAWDDHLRDWLSTAQTYAEDLNVIVRLAPEMNDTARPWSALPATAQHPGSSPSDYVDMWRHVAALKEVHAPDVMLMWNPLNYGAGPAPFEDYFPGSEYVDTLALDGFNWDHAAPAAPGWQSPDDVFGFSRADGPITRLAALAGDKPWGIAEVASAPDDPASFLPGGANYSAWGTWVFDYPENPPYEQVADDWVTQEGWTRMMILRAADAGASFVNYFHTNKETDWRLTDTPSGREVFHVLADRAG
ncbi:glycoside hydrolase family 26 protein [Zhihengliuella flava]|uniref:GH26 domain-containing protein n=1 Tax=Zhihengliuella flava TaxID=1285193 RepID=A0A931GM61_9MICC|nr:hypothetical protein [Zhihengliuella flava]MBG6085099.1 hypothetical protein [Zhihengliuella flava]